MSRPRLWTLGLTAWMLPATLGCGAAASEPTPEAARVAPRDPPRARATTIEMAITVDDLPLHGPDYVGIDRVAIADALLRAFAAHRVPRVYGFVNGARLDEHPESIEVLRHWVVAGNPLGNHTYSHISLNDAPVDRYLADLERGEDVLRRLIPNPQTWKVFRYPYLFEGPDLEKRNAVRGWLAAHRYAIAEVSVDGDDWAWNPVFARCSDAHDDAALDVLRDGMVKTHIDELRFMRNTTRELSGGREVPQILLMHIGAADAYAIDALLTAFEAEGVRFIELEQALADPFYAQDPASPSRAGAAFPYAVARSRGVRLPELPERPEEEALDSMCLAAPPGRALPALGPRANP